MWEGDPREADSYLHREANAYVSRMFLPCAVWTYVGDKISSESRSESEARRSRVYYSHDSRDRGDDRDV